MDGRLQFEWYDIENDPEGWDANVAGVGQNLFHRSAMLSAQRFGAAFRRGVVVKRFGASVCVIGGLVTPERGGGCFQSLSFPSRVQQAERNLPHELINWLMGQGVTRVVLGSFDGGVENYECGPVKSLVDRLEFLYDLTIPEDLRLRMANNNHRRQLRKSQQAQMRLAPIEKHQAWVMARLNATWARRRGERYNLRRLITTYRYYRALTAALAEDRCANLYGLYDGRGQLLSMAYMLECGDSSFYMIGASSDAGYKSGGSVRLFWELAHHYPSIGIRTMNFGGVPAQARQEGHEEFGVYRFKLGFGIEPTLRQTLTIEA